MLVDAEQSAGRAVSEERRDHQAEADVPPWSEIAEQGRGNQESPSDEDRDTSPTILVRLVHEICLAMGSASVRKPVPWR